MTTLNGELRLNPFFISAKSNTSECEDIINIDENVINYKWIDPDTRFEHYFLNESTEMESIHSFTNPVKTRIFGVVYPEKVSLFTQLDNYTSTKEETQFLKRKRLREKRRRRDNRDNIRKKIKRGFFNFGLIKGLNEKLRRSGSRLNFERFPQNFVSDVSKESNKELLNMSLFEIFENKNLYERKEKEEEDETEKETEKETETERETEKEESKEEEVEGKEEEKESEEEEKKENLKNYYHNLKVIKSDDIQENADLRRILNKKYCELFEEYVNSKEFEDEVKRLKEKNMSDDYIERYIILAKYYVEYFSNQI